MTSRLQSASPPASPSLEPASSFSPSSTHLLSGSLSIDSYFTHLGGMYIPQSFPTTFSTLIRKALCHPALSPTCSHASSFFFWNERHTDPHNLARNTLCNGTYIFSTGTSYSAPLSELRDVFREQTALDTASDRLNAQAFPLRKYC